MTLPRLHRLLSNSCSIIFVVTGCCTSEDLGQENIDYTFPIREFDYSLKLLRLLFVYYTPSVN